MIEVLETKLPGVLLIKPSIFEDFRGHYIEVYNEKEYMEKGISVKFVVDDVAVSSKGVLRGIHGDNKTWKLISCLYGKIYLVAVNCDTDSKDFGQWESFIISESNGYQVLVPPNYGNAHLILSDHAVFHYMQSEYYDRAGQFTYRYDDKLFGIWWPIKNPILSQRDEGG